MCDHNIIVCNTNYTILNRNSGNYSDVFHVVNAFGEKRVLKIMKSHFDKNMMDMEVCVLSQLKDLDCVQLYNTEWIWYNQEYRLCLVMSDLGTQTLTEYYNKNIPSLQEFIRIALRLTELLIQLHELNIIHRDIKPDNIMWNDGLAQFIDFGFADIYSNNNTIQTRNKGTKTYQSLDIHDLSCGIPLTLSITDLQSCDIWALGCVLYYIAEGQHLFYYYDNNYIQRTNIHRILDSTECGIVYDIIFNSQLFETNPTNRISLYELYNKLFSIQYKMNFQ